MSLKLAFLQEATWGVRNVKKNALRIAITLVVVFVLLWLVVGPWMSTPSPQVPEVPERVAPVSS